MQRSGNPPRQQQMGGGEVLLRLEEDMAKVRLVQCLLAPLWEGDLGVRGQRMSPPTVWVSVPRPRRTNPEGVLV
jgi:hypothetical protein